MTFYRKEVFSGSFHCVKELTILPDEIHPNLSLRREMTDEHTKKVVVDYSKSKDYRIVAATGAWGGLSPQGEIICNFFVEQTVEPVKIEMTFDAQGKLVDESIMNKSELPYYTRELQIGVVMRPDIAKTIGQWLIDQSDKISPLLDNEKPIKLG